MELLIRIISILLILSLISSPILVLFKLKKSQLKYNFIIYLIVSIILTFILVLISAWWGYISQKILLSHYGYNFGAMNNLERFQKVAMENLERVKRLEINMLGIGWPAKALMFYVFYTPYLLIVYIIYYFRKKYKKTKV